MSKIKFVFLIFALIFTGKTSSQWSADYRLTNSAGNSFTSYNNAHNIASSAPLTHVVWEDNRFGNDEILYKRSTDNGLNWEAVVRLTNYSGNSNKPSISLSGQMVHVVWYDNRDGNDEIYYKQSTDAGNTWGPDIRLTTNNASSLYPVISVSGSIVQVIWQDDRDGNFEIYFKRSSDNGINWEPVLRLTNNAASSDYPSIYTSGLYSHIIWQDERDGNKEIYYNRSFNFGIGWGIETRLTTNSNESSYPCICGSAQFIHAVWNDNRDGNFEIYYKRSTDNGLNWEAVQRLTNNSAFSLYPSIVSSGQYLYLTWADARSGNFGIYYNTSSNSGVSWFSDLKLNTSNEEARAPSVSVSGNTIHTVWYDSRDNDYEIYYKRNPTGNPVGVNVLNTEIPSGYSLSQNYPNPFNPVTNFEFRIADFGLVNLTIYDALGKAVETLVNNDLNPGTYKAELDASKYNSGVYFYRLSSGNYTETKKMILVK